MQQKFLTKFDVNANGKNFYPKATQLFILKLIPIVFYEFYFKKMFYCIFNPKIMIYVLNSF